MAGDNDRKPLGRTNYGSIPHLPGSRRGTGDRGINEGQARIACGPRDPSRKDDLIIVQEKLDGSNVGVVKLNGNLLALTRAGYLAHTSPWVQHHYFSLWVALNRSRFDSLLEEGERVCGEWLMQAHGTLYRLHHEPFVAFDIMREDDRAPYLEVQGRCEALDFVMPALIGWGIPMPIEEAMDMLEASLLTPGTYGYHGALEPVEGAVWRVETGGKFNFACKYVRPDKVDGKYMLERSTRWNENVFDYLALDSG